MSVVTEINAVCADPVFRSRLTGFLKDICSIDTTLGSDIDRIRSQEQAVFARISEEIIQLPLEGYRLYESPISPAIQSHPAYSLPYYTVTQENPGGLRAEETYKGRGSLLCCLDNPHAPKGRNTALDAHIDVVSPFQGPLLTNDRISGRGTADDKGNVAAMVGALFVLAQLARSGKVSLRNKITAMFVTDEEIGGNGSLDLALKKEVMERFDSLLILECTGNKMHPANRGAVFFKGEIRHADPAPVRKAGSPSVSEAMAFAILEMEKEGDSIRKESDHPLFPHRPVQTCNGMLGRFGSHPSSICGEMQFVIEHPEGAHDEALIEQSIRDGLAEYVAKYGDKSRKKFAVHYSQEKTGTAETTVKVFGSTGHMGSLPENDAAITKWAYIARSLVVLKYRSSLRFTLALSGLNEEEGLVLEGGQGFLPTHGIEEIKTRMSRAFQRGIERFAEISVRKPGEMTGSMTFDKLHNDAFACDPGSPSMTTAREAAEGADIMDRSEPLIGWHVSCDARLFAKEHPRMPVITCGAGRLEHAHAKEEMLFLPEMFRTVAFIALFLIRETGSLCTGSDPEF